MEPRGEVEREDGAGDCPRNGQQGGNLLRHGKVALAAELEGRLDVSGWARDAVALALPDKILCRPDCAGLCPECGKNLNDEPHTHEETETDPRWAALEALRDDV